MDNRNIKQMDSKQKQVPAPKPSRSPCRTCMWQVTGECDDDCDALTEWLRTDNKEQGSETMTSTPKQIANEMNELADQIDMQTVSDLTAIKALRELAARVRLNDHDIQTPAECRASKDHRDDGKCVVCDHGLAVCKRCGGGESELDESCADRLKRQLDEASAKLSGLLAKSPIVSLQGIAFGNTWYSFDTLTGCTAERPEDRKVFYSQIIPAGFVRWANEWAVACEAARK